ncbi:hypothetical protein V2G26_015645 [Clonostachys chloroleuca]
MLTVTLPARWKDPRRGYTIKLPKTSLGSHGSKNWRAVETSKERRHAWMNSGPWPRYLSLMSQETSSLEGTEKFSPS